MSEASAIWAQKSLGPLEKPLEIADYVFCPHRKISSRTIRNSGALIVIIKFLRKTKLFWMKKHCLTRAVDIIQASSRLNFRIL